MKKLLTLLSTLIFLSTPFLLFALTEKASPELLKLIHEAGDLQKYPDANAIIIFDNATVEYEKDGKFVDEEHALIKVLTQAGQKHFGERHFPYYRVYSKIEIKTARVIKPDGTIINVPEDMIKDISEAMAARMNIYDEDIRDRVITFKNLEIGDAIEYKVCYDYFHPPMDNAFSDQRTFQSINPILKQTYIITGPKDLPLRYVVRNGNLNLTKKEEKGKIMYKWNAENIERVITEPAMPPFHEIFTTLVVTTIDSWENVSKWWCDIAESKMAMDDSLRAKVSQLTRDKKTEEEKIYAIYHFVAQKIRYMGLGTGIKKGFEPKPVTETFHTKYGVCRDVATLMTAMLREAGIESHVVLTGAGYEMEKELPTINFNHAIVALKDEKGEYYFADPTVENLPDLLPSFEHEQDVLVCTKNGEKLSRTQHAPAEDNMGYISANSSLSENGTFISNITFTTRGLYDMAFRSWCKRMPPQQIKMIWHQILQNVYPGAQLTDFDMSDTEDLYRPFTMKISFEIKDYALDADKYVLVKLPLASGNFELISRSVLGSANLPTRNYPWKINTTFGAREEEMLTFPESYKIKAVPDEVNTKEGPVSYQMVYIPTILPEPEGKNAVHYSKEWKIDAKELSTEEYLKLKSIMQTSAKSARGEVIFVKSKGDL